MPDDFVAKVKQGVREIAEGSPFVGVGKHLADAGGKIVNEYRHLRQRWGTSPSAKRAPAAKRSVTTRR